jgi:hypothetical protein
VGKPNLKPAKKNLAVKPGSGRDLCPLCGIKREFAGYTELTCGEHLHEPDCFVTKVAP